MVEDEVFRTEQRALAFGKWANASMAFLGVAAGWYSNSDALLVDGFYSAVNFAAAIIAARVGNRIRQPISRAQPFGRDLEETIYVTFRSLVLIGMLLFAALTSARKIFDYVNGAEIAPLDYAVIGVYIVVVISVATVQAAIFWRAYVVSEKRSGILRAESTAAINGGVISLCAGVVLLGLPHLYGTPLEPIIPVGDSILVLVLAAVIIWRPLSIFRSAISELAGFSASGKNYTEACRVARESAQAAGYQFQRAAVVPGGRVHFCIIYIDPLRRVDAHEITAFHRTVQARLMDAIGPTRMEVVLWTDSDELLPVP